MTKQHRRRSKEKWLNSTTRESVLNKVCSTKRITLLTSMKLSPLWALRTSRAKSCCLKRESKKLNTRSLKTCCHQKWLETTTMDLKESLLSQCSADCSVIKLHFSKSLASFQLTRRPSWYSLTNSTQTSSPRTLCSTLLTLPKRYQKSVAQSSWSWIDKSLTTPRWRDFSPSSTPREWLLLSWLACCHKSNVLRLFSNMASLNCPSDW